MAEFEQRLVLGLSAAQLKKLRTKEVSEGKSPRQVLEMAGVSGVACRIIYVRDDGQTEERWVDPYEWKVTGGDDERSDTDPTEKLYAFCRVHKRCHSFHMHNIIHVEIRPELTRVAPFPYKGPRSTAMQGSDMTVEEWASLGRSAFEGGLP